MIGCVRLLLSVYIFQETKKNWQTIFQENFLKATQFLGNNMKTVFTKKSKQYENDV